jgi:hypothetical protein
MGVAKFIAIDQFVPSATKEELDNLLGKMEGVQDWAINPNVEIAVEYDHNRINDEMIEAALRGIGFKLKHISDSPDLPDEIAQEELDQEEYGLRT